MSYQDFPPALLILSPRLTSAGNPSASVVGINTTPLADGSFVYCLENRGEYQLDKQDNSTVPDGVNVLGPLSGPGRWNRRSPLTSARFTPTFQSTNADASIGDGSIVGSFWIDGKILHVETFVTWGTTSTIGTGNLLVPMPLGYTGANIDPNGLLNAPGAATTFGYGIQILAGSFKASPVIALLSGTQLFLALDSTALAALTPNDTIAWALNLPLL